MPSYKKGKSQFLQIFVICSALSPFLLSEKKKKIKNQGQKKVVSIPAFHYKISDMHFKMWII